MPLLDHFRPPLSERRHWHAFHNSWATYLSADLNERLPEGFFAEANVQFAIEIDVAAFDEGAGGMLPAWAPPAPTRTLSFPVTTDVVEVAVYAREGGPTLSAAIELVSPANKDRDQTRGAFVSKCETYLREGIGLVVVDVVTSRRADLHHEILRRLGEPAGGEGGGLYAVAYHPVRRGDETALDLWEASLAVADPLPALPLWLKGSGAIPVDLDASYARACREQRVSSSSR